jgi:hypothetical protein|tara:strand:+ start:729 stop:1160 length:432 start_codon:yes stop_codon:yes gene_type:complete
MEHDKEYFAYGHYGYYKKRILEKMFDITDLIEVYLAEKEQLSKDAKLTPTQLKTIWRVPLKLKLAISELTPKFNSVKDRKGKLPKLFEIVKDINDIHKYSNRELIIDSKRLYYFYEQYITFIELLGYSNMNVIQGDKEDGTSY